MAPSLTPRASSTDDTSNHLSGVYIGGIVFAALFALSMALWLGIRHVRSRNRKRRANTRNSAFLTVKGVVAEKEINPNDDSAFTRKNIGGVVMPSSRDEILAYHSATGTLTHAFKLSVSNPTAQDAPASPALPAEPPHAPGQRRPGVGPRQPSRLNPDAPLRSSFNPAFVLGSQTSLSHSERPVSTISWAPPPSSPGSGRFSFAGSWRHSRGSSGSSAGGLGARTVHQVFAPVLPDELLLAVGERVHVVQALDDGWCVVGRAGGVALAGAGAFGQAAGAADGNEMGVVPAWVFVKPVKGLRAERPMRTTSLGVTVEVPAPAFAGREQVMSWSNF